MPDLRAWDRLRRYVLVVAVAVAVLDGLGYALLIPRRSLSPRNDQVAAGRSVFLARCAKCHGARGEGRTGRTLVAAWDPLAGYRTADQLFAYMSRAMPHDKPGSLTETEYWEVIAFLLSANDILPPGLNLGAANAAQVKTTK
jgi:mono/diheme cytochrome c family protein